MPERSVHSSVFKKTIVPSPSALTERPLIILIKHSADARHHRIN